MNTRLFGSGRRWSVVRHSDLQTISIIKKKFQWQSNLLPIGPTRYCITPIYGSGYIVVLLKDLTKSAKDKHR